MTLPSYQVAIISCTTGQTLSVLDPTGFYEMRYSRVLNDIGVCALVLPSTAALRALFSLDNFIEISRTDPVTGDLAREETYLVRSTQRFREGDEEKFTIGGFSLNHLLTRRLVDPDDDPLEAGGYSTKAGPSDTVLRAYAREQMADLASADRQMPGLTVPVVAGTGTSVGARLRHENLLKVFQDLAVRGAMDFTITRTTGANLELIIAAQGADKTQSTNYPLTPYVGLSPQRGNLSAPNLTLDHQEEGNFVYALGQGQGADRTVLKLAGDGLADSPWNRLEFVDDVRNIEKGDALALLTGAKAALFEKRARKTFTFEPTGLEPGNIYRQNWDVGDKITVNWDESMFDLQFRSVDIQVNNAGETITAEVETFERPA